MNVQTLNKKLRHAIIIECQAQAEVKAESLLKFARVGQTPLTEEMTSLLSYYAQVGALEAVEYLEKQGLVKFEGIV